MLERLNRLEWIVNQQYQEIKILQKKNTMLEKIIENTKDEDTKVKQANDLKLKTEEDFYKEVIEAKQANILLTDHFEIIEKEKGMLEEKIRQLEKISKIYVVKMEEKLMEKDENVEE